MKRMRKLIRGLMAGLAALVRAGGGDETEDRDLLCHACNALAVHANARHNGGH